MLHKLSVGYAFQNYTTSLTFEEMHGQQRCRKLQPFLARAMHWISALAIFGLFGVGL